MTLLGPRQHGKWVSFFGLFCSGPPGEPHLSTESVKVTLGAPKCLPKLSKIIEQLPQNHQNIKTKKTPEYGYQFLVKKVKEKWWAFRPLFHVFVLLVFYAEYRVSLVCYNSSLKVTLGPPKCVPK